MDKTKTKLNKKIVISEICYLIDPYDFGNGNEPVVVPCKVMSIKDGIAKVEKITDTDFVNYLVDNLYTSPITAYNVLKQFPKIGDDIYYEDEKNQTVKGTVSHYNNYYSYKEGGRSYADLTLLAKAGGIKANHFRVSKMGKEFFKSMKELENIKEL